MAMHGYGMGSCARGDLYEHMAASDAGTTRCRCIWVGLFLFFSLFCVSVGLVFASDSLICWAVDVVKQPRAANKARVGRSLFSVSVTGAAAERASCSREGTSITESAWSAAQRLTTEQSCTLMCFKPTVGRAGHRLASKPMSKPLDVVTLAPSIGLVDGWSQLSSDTWPLKCDTFLCLRPPLL